MTFDPIDGTSVIDSNFAIASIFAIWKNKNINGTLGKDLVGAAISIYGSRTTVVLYNSQSQKVEELTLLRMGIHERWIVTNLNLIIKPDAKLFAPALKSAYAYPSYIDLFEDYCLKGYSIRYSGCFAVDCY